MFLNFHKTQGRIRTRKNRSKIFVLSIFVFFMILCVLSVFMSKRENLTNLMNSEDSVILTECTFPRIKWQRPLSVQNWSLSRMSKRDNLTNLVDFKGFCVFNRVDLSADQMTAAAIRSELITFKVVQARKSDKFDEFRGFCDFNRVHFSADQMTAAAIRSELITFKNVQARQSDKFGGFQRILCF